ncbi:hypothetical protein M3Y96_00977200 [Aphelenchoides besseyi]|nr:hypothetical protein M3Y96_00977200 [Aphelenchoides besseyi]
MEELAPELFGTVFCLLSLFGLILYITLIGCHFSDRFVYERSSCFWLLMCVNLCAMLQLLMHFYAGISALSQRQSDWTYVEHLIVSIGNATVMIQEFLNFAIAVDRFVVLVLEWKKTKMLVALMFTPILILFLLYTTSFMLPSCRYFFRSYIWEISVSTCRYLDAMQNLEYCLYVLMILAVIFHVLIVVKLFFTRRLLSQNFFGGVERRVLLRSFGTLLTGGLTLLFMHTLHSYILPGNLPVRIMVQFWWIFSNYFAVLFDMSTIPNLRRQMILWFFAWPSNQLGSVVGVVQHTNSQQNKNVNTIQIR